MLIDVRKYKQVSSFTTTYKVDNIIFHLEIPRSYQHLLFSTIILVFVTIIMLI
jgi:hypothetical protein